ncbi:MAG: preprotein translocase subunit SecA [Candidatus Nanosyncoccus sp. P13S_S20_bin.18.1]|nr:preprotein translocase subunit SecA [Candidatus Nanosyncoccus sp. P13S_S20_bin.18.1]
MSQKKIEKIQEAKIKAPKVKKERKPTDKLADKTTTTRILQGVFGDPAKRNLTRMRKIVKIINGLEQKYEAMSDDELKAQTNVLKERLDTLNKKAEANIARAKLKASAKKSETKAESNDSTKKQSTSVKSEKLERNETKILSEILPDAFALVREATKRVLGMRHYDVQMIGGIVLHEGNVAEMKTGEGKTLVALLPSFLNALTGRGVHVVTVNDYLAQRDAGWNAPVYHFLGMSIGVIIADASFLYDPEYINEEHTDERMQHLKPCTRKQAYQADVTYGTNNEFGFDYLRDNMVNEVDFLRQRELNFAIVDEVDSILIDEARTPLIISAPAGDNPDSYYQFAKIASHLGPDDYVLDEKHRSVSLTDAGIEKVQRMLGIDNLYSADNTRLVYHMDQALRAQIVFQRDRDYVVTNSGEVIIVDENTGRLMQGRRYSEGLHQAIEAKESVVVKEESMTLATISFQNFFRLYNKLSGMTGTAFTEAEEFQQIYALDVIQIPPNRPIIRIDKDDLIFRTEAGKLRAIVEEVKKFHEKGQPVLIGSASIVKNELIAKYLDEAGLSYELLNAKNNEREAAIVEKAGQKGAITLATNMAGRGTDIKLTDEVKELGGLVVIGSERHDSRRVDNQLRGRGGRQGDPGITQFFVSCEDDLMRIFQGNQIGAMLNRIGIDEDTPIQNRSVTKMLEAAQKRIEGFNFDSRKNVVQYDNVINRHRRIVYLMRRKILEGANISDEINRLIKEAVADLTAESIRVNRNFIKEFQSVFDLDRDLIIEIGFKRKAEERAKLATLAVKEAYATKELEFGADVMRKIEREVYLKVLDALWMQHLENMQYLREGIHWRSIGQRDPLVEYRTESQKLFEGLQKNLREEVLKILLSITPQEAVATDTIDGEEYDTELTKMAESATNRGVNTIEAGEKNLDDEFTKKPTRSASLSEKRNKAKKQKKAKRQNKKHGRR